MNEQAWGMLAGIAVTSIVYPLWVIASRLGAIKDELRRQDRGRP